MGIGDGMENAGIYSERRSGVGKILAEGGEKGLERGLRREVEEGKRDDMSEEMFGRNRGQGEEGEGITVMGKGKERMYRGRRTEDEGDRENKEKAWKKIEREEKRKQEEGRWKEESKYNRW